MEAKLQKWGNSDGIRIPKNIIKALNLKTDDKLELIQKDNNIIISKPKKEKISLNERFQAYKGLNLAKEYEWDDPQGKEIW